MESDVSLLRLYLLRGVYAFITLGLMIYYWPGVVLHGNDIPQMNGVVASMLVAMSLLTMLGIRYPLQMLPVLVFELLWKIIWLLSFALPLWLAGQLSEPMLKAVYECMLVVVVPLVVPWRYVYARFVKTPGDRWRGGLREASSN